MTKNVVALITVLAGLAGPLRAGSGDPVAVSSTSSAEYAGQKFGPGAPKPETYLFYQGRFFGGTTRDPNLEHAQFTEIATTLGANLVRQNYFPTKDRRHADLLIVVHWGVTTVYEDPNRELNAENRNSELNKYNTAVAAAATDTGNILSNLAPGTEGINGELAIAGLEQAATGNSIASNAQLLGFRRDLALAERQTENGGVNDELGLKELLTEERYFVILMAYDFHTMKKGTAPKLLWSTRFSIRAPGNSFTKALPVMSRVAADYFGHALDGLKFETPDAPKGKVDVGKPTVVGDGK